MRIIPVLDVKQGQVVRGVAGRRQEYRPVISRLSSSPQPLALARAFRQHFGLAELYLADLDALAGQPPDLTTYSNLRADGFQLWVDAGIRHSADAVPLARAGVETIVAGLETLAGPTILADLCRQYSPQKIVFSLDLKEGLPLGAYPAWGTDSPLELARKALDAGCRRILVLDLVRVGVGAGTGTEDLCRKLATEFAGMEIAAGGGVRGPHDLRRLEQAGVKVVLVASALHDGKIKRQDMELQAQEEPGR